MFGLKTIAAGLAVGAILGGGAGLGGVALWSKTPWSASSKLKATRADLDKALADLEAEKRVSSDRLQAIQQRDQQAINLAKADAGDATASAAAWGAQCSAAFNAGVSAGRRICNVPSSAAGAGQPAAGVVRPSFRSEFELERYAPAADRLPGAR